MASPRHRDTTPLAAAVTAQGKRRRRPATGKAETYRKGWGRTWGGFMSQQAAKLRTESEENE